MRGSEIKAVFQSAGVKIPDGLDVSAFDVTECWCCGYWAEQVGEEVALQKYCRKGRGTIYVDLITKNGEVRLSYPLSSYALPGELTHEEDLNPWEE